MGSKRSPERMEALRARFMVGANEKGVTADVAHQIFDKLKAFSDFGFPESHSFSFAYLVYASAWLKAHQPAAFYAGLLAAQPMGFYSPQSLAADARRHGQVLLRPCVARSEALAVVERVAEPFVTPQEARPDMVALTRVDRTLAVRMGLAAVRGLGVDAAQAIVDARAAGPFASLTDMARRVRVKPKPDQSQRSSDVSTTFPVLGQSSQRQFYSRSQTGCRANGAPLSAGARLGQRNGLRGAPAPGSWLCGSDACRLVRRVPAWTAVGLLAISICGVELVRRRVWRPAKPALSPFDRRAIGY